MTDVEKYSHKRKFRIKLISLSVKRSPKACHFCMHLNVQFNIIHVFEDLLNTRHWCDSTLRLDKSCVGLLCVCVNVVCVCQKCTRHCHSKNYAQKYGDGWVNSQFKMQTQEHKQSGVEMMPPSSVSMCVQIYLHINVKQFIFKFVQLYYLEIRIWYFNLLFFFHLVKRVRFFFLHYESRWQLSHSSICKSLFK